MQYIKPEISTICFGQAASAAAVLLAAGAQGKRLALPHARILLHQPWGSGGGQATDIEIQAREILRMKDLLNEILARPHRPAPGADRAGHRPRLRPRGRRGQGVRHHRRGHQRPGAGRQLRPDHGAPIGQAVARSGSSTGRQGERWRSSETAASSQVLVLRQVAEAGQEAHRRARRLHLRRVHRPLQRDHRGGARRDLRAALRRAAQARRRSSSS